MDDIVIIHYDEIGLKGKNRGNFESMLVQNIKKKLDLDSYQIDMGYILIKPKKFDIDKIKDVLTKVPGIAFFSFAKQSSLDVEQLKKDVIEFMKNKEYETFKVDTRRYDKTFKMTSLELNALLGEVIIDKYGKKVKMKNQDLNLKVEIGNKETYISSENIKGVGGFPINTTQKVVALISGGFDSPVAAYLMMKRGCEVVLVHFQNQNQMSASVEDKVTRLAEQLSKFQINTKLYIIPFEELQKEIIKNVEAKTRMLIYRRFMIKIASKIAELEKASFLVVGDSLSQVASQTLSNLEATYDGSEKHILSPLIGFDKKEIVDISRQIGTYDISSLPYGDCCSYFLPEHPVLKSRADILKKVESTIDISLVESAINKARIINL